MVTLLDKLRTQRESTVEIEPGKTLTVRRPLAAQMNTLRQGVTPELVASHITGWANVTEADLLGAAIGASDPAPFSAELVAEVLADRPEWLAKASDKLVECVNAWFEQRGAIAKN